MQRCSGGTVNTPLLVPPAPLLTRAGSPCYAAPSPSLPHRSSMGNDSPLAAMSSRPKLLFDYFKQLFAQAGRGAGLIPQFGGWRAAPSPCTAAAGAACFSVRNRGRSWAAGGVAVALTGALGGWSLGGLAALASLTPVTRAEPSRRIHPPTHL